MATGIPPKFVVRLTTRDKQGNVTGHQEFVTYQGLLAIAHEQGLKGIETTLLQVPEPAPIWWTPDKGLRSREYRRCSNATHDPIRSRRTPYAA